LAGGFSVMRTVTNSFSLTSYSSSKVAGKPLTLPSATTRCVPGSTENFLVSAAIGTGRSSNFTARSWTPGGGTNVT
jgi:hypothetical protein